MPLPTPWDTTLFLERINSPRGRTKDGGCLPMSWRMWCNSRGQVGFMLIQPMKNVVRLLFRSKRRPETHRKPLRLPGHLLHPYRPERALNFPSVQRAAGNSALSGLIQRQPVKAPPKYKGRPRGQSIDEEPLRPPDNWRSMPTRYA